MNLASPTLQLDEEASVVELSDAVVALEGKEAPFLILSRDPMTYMQTLWTPDGFILEYQEGSIAEHYVAEELLTADAVCDVLTQYLQGVEEWRSAYQFSNKGIAGLSWRIGHLLGWLSGRICALFRRS
ncbi:hypothetical protein TQ33_1789 [Kangiella geojedonensis]|uniref:Uncharacterized protein n=2 Tax=Kangiella geojedonensis TaxID=914150 RepID=A0A0F6TRF5_9GAMM|nr:hypothetical protein TQ33_1789 [Kangiella geojedonensis]